MTFRFNTTRPEKKVPAKEVFVQVATPFPEIFQEQPSDLVEVPSALRIFFQRVLHGYDTEFMADDAQQAVREGGQQALGGGELGDYIVQHARDEKTHWTCHVIDWLIDVRLEGRPLTWIAKRSGRTKPKCEG